MNLRLVISHGLVMPFCLAWSLAAAAPARALPETAIRYEIAVRVVPATRRLKGKETIRWKNRSKRTIAAVPLHLYLNAFSHTSTTWVRELRSNFPSRIDIDRLLEVHPDPWGHVALTAVTQSSGGRSTGKTAAWRPIRPDDGNELDRTLVEVTLPDPVPPGGTLTLNIAFEGRLPAPIARTGCASDFCLVAQWFPKIGVLETAGVRHAAPRWAARQFHGPTEFYSDFADYSVTVDAPAGWAVGATGREIPDRSGARPAGRHRFEQRAVHDFAIVMGRGLVDRKIRHRPAGGGPEVEVRYMMPAAGAGLLPRTRWAIENGLDQLGHRLGPYPYKTLTVVLPPWHARGTGGMEYPTLITGSTGESYWQSFLLSDLRAFEGTLVHELAHQYFYGLVANNEQEEAFLDEGLTSYWQVQIQRALYGAAASGGYGLGRRLDMTDAFSWSLAADRRRIREPLRRRPSALFFPGTHGAQIYARGMLTLWTAEKVFGRRSLDRVFAGYFRRHRFGHPDADDLLAAAAAHGGGAMAAFLTEAFEQGPLPDYRVTSIRSTPFVAPLGRVTKPSGKIIVIRPGDQIARRAEVVDSRMLDRDGKVWVQITDPGWSRRGRHVDGAVTWGGFAHARARPITKISAGDPLHESEVLVQGPGWDHLPTRVTIRFEDGAEIAEPWDGRAAWRAYRIIRRSPVRDVHIDRDRRIAVDVLPQNNARTTKPDVTFVADWSGWLCAAVQWLAGGVSLWL